MAERDYTLKYDATSAVTAAAAIDQLAAALTRCDAAATQLAPKIRAVTGNVSRSVNGTADAYQRLAGELARTDKAAASAAGSVASATTAAKENKPHTEAATSSVAGFGTALMALGAAKQVFSAILEESEKIEARWKAMADEAAEFRKHLRELASLRGESGPNNKVAADVLAMAVQARITPEVAGKAMASYENIGPTVREKGHYKPADGDAGKLERDVLTDALRTGNRLGVDAETAGEAIGTAGMFHTFRTREDAAQQFGGAVLGLSEGKVGYTAGVRALNKAAAKLVDPKEAGAEGARASHLNSFAEAGIYMGAMSLGTGTADQAQMRMIQVSRLLNPESANEEGNAALRQAGVTDDLSDPDKLIRLSQYMKEQKIDDPLRWLEEHKLGSRATREATVAGLKVTDVLGARLDRYRKGADVNAAGRRTLAENDEFRKKDQSSAEESVDTTAAVLDKQEGLAGAEIYEKAKKAAENRVRIARPDWYNSASYGLLGKLNSVVTGPMYGVSGSAYAYEQSATHELENQGRRHGIDVKKRFPGLYDGDYNTRAKAFSEAARAVTEAGGDPLGTAGTEAAARRRVDALRPGGAGAAPAPPPPPATPPAGGAGAGPVAQLNEEQLRVLRRIEGHLDPSGRGRYAPLPVDGADSGPLRA